MCPIEPLATPKTAQISHVTMCAPHKMLDGPELEGKHVGDSKLDRVRVDRGEGDRRLALVMNVMNVLGCLGSVHPSERKVEDDLDRGDEHGHL